MRVAQNFESKKVSAEYSESLLRAVVLNQNLARSNLDTRNIINHNSACVFFAVAFLEAKINEIITKISESGSSNTDIPAQHWKRMKDNEKKLKVDEKWNYLASAYGGKIWNNEEKIFRDFEVIKSLRNELVHYKGDPLEAGKAPNKKLTHLLKQFSGQDVEMYGYKISDGESQGWLYQLLSSPNFGKWVTLCVLEFDIKEKELLCGKEITSSEKMHYWNKWEPNVGIFIACSRFNMGDTEKVFKKIEQIMFPHQNDIIFNINLSKLFRLFSKFTNKLKRKVLTEI